MRILSFLFLLTLSGGLCLAATATGVRPHPPRAPPHTEYRPIPYYGSSSTTNWLVIYIILSHNSQHYYVQDRGQFNNITLSSNCSEIVNVTLDISGQNETISLGPYEPQSIYINDTICQNFTGFHLYQISEYFNCTVTVDYSFIPCDPAYGMFLADIILLGILIVLVLICGIAIRVRTYCKRSTYNDMP